MARQIVRGIFVKGGVDDRVEYEWSDVRWDGWEVKMMFVFERGGLLTLIHVGVLNLNMPLNTDKQWMAITKLLIWQYQV
jgi:hypothetical protein